VGRISTGEAEVTVTVVMAFRVKVREARSSGAGGSGVDQNFENSREVAIAVISVSATKILLHSELVVLDSNCCMHRCEKASTSVVRQSSNNLPFSSFVTHTAHQQHEHHITPIVNLPPCRPKEKTSSSQSQSRRARSRHQNRRLKTTLWKPRMSTNWPQANGEPVMSKSVFGSSTERSRRTTKA
jgi:hypothetical protein